MANSHKRYFEVLNWASSFLDTHQKEPYIAEYLILERNFWTKTDLLGHYRQVMPISEITQLEADLELVLQDIPPQYIIGSCQFYGQRFKVTADTLIPRPETEELVQLCLQGNESSKALKVIDVGTGTGAIALSLKKQAPNWQVTAVDISDKALAVAEENGERLALDCRFLKSDLLTAVISEQFDVIISNPPYIGTDEWQEMDVSVRKYEPKLALFAEKEGLALYMRLAKEAKTVIKPTGKIYLEIGYRQGEAVKQIFKEAFPTKKVVVHQDLTGHDRMIEVC